MPKMIVGFSLNFTHSPTLQPLQAAVMAEQQLTASQAPAAQSKDERYSKGLEAISELLQSAVARDRQINRGNLVVRSAIWPSGTGYTGVRVCDLKSI